MTISEASVLVVDDEPNVLLTLQAVLEQEGYQVFGSLTAAGARQHFAVRRFDACLLDLRLEDGDGMELLEELRVQQEDCAPIVLTGFASMESAIRATRLGAYDYLLKPCDVNDLKLTVARAVEHANMARALRQKIGELEDANAVIRSFADQLEQRVAEATRDLNDKVVELDGARRQLDEAFELRERFISMVVHELRSPLTSILGFAQLLERTGLPEASRARAIHAIREQAQRLARLLSDLADASRLASGRFQVEPQVCDLVQIAREQTELTRMASSRHTVEFVAPVSEVVAVCDRDRISQVLTNLLSNAVKYGTGQRIICGLQADGVAALLTVHDDGDGIPADQREAIFQPYVRGTSLAGANDGGSGLGLYIARGIVEAHGGTLTLESAPGAGTTFMVRLPLSFAEAPLSQSLPTP